MSDEAREAAWRLHFSIPDQDTQSVIYRDEPDYSASEMRNVWNTAWDAAIKHEREKRQGPDDWVPAVGDEVCLVNGAGVRFTVSHVADAAVFRYYLDGEGKAFARFELRPATP